MKKIILLCILTLIVFTSYSTSSYAKPKKNIPEFEPNIDAPEPDYYTENNDPVDPSETVSIRGLCPTGDQYEYNDEFGFPTYIQKSSVTYATLHTTPWYCGGTYDKDYYYFTLSRNTEMNIRLENIPGSVNYNIKLYSEEYGFIQGSYNYDDIDESIIKTLAPGTYYIYVYSANGFDENNEYKLSASNSTIYPSSIDLTPTVKSNYAGAVWESQYYPRDLDPESYNGEMIDHCYASQTMLNCDPPMRMLSEFGMQDEYVSRIFYVWGKSEKEELADVIKLVVADLQIYDSIYPQLQLALSAGSAGIVILSYITPTGVVLSTISLGIAAISMVIPNIEVDTVEYAIYLAYLAGVLEESADGVVVQIKENYQVDVQSIYVPGGLGGGYESYLEYFIETNTTLVSPVYTETIINRYQSGNPFYGDISLLTDMTAIEDLFNIS